MFAITTALILHDLLEGVAQYEIKLLFGYLTSQNFISEQDLLFRIYSFDYGFLERKNRPTKVILESAGNSIGLNSIQTLCLVKNLPLLLGDIVPPGQKNWSLFVVVTHSFFTLSHSWHDSLFEEFDC